MEEDLEKRMADMTLETIEDSLSEGETQEEKPQQRYHQPSGLCHCLESWGAAKSLGVGG